VIAGYLHTLALFLTAETDEPDYEPARPASSKKVNIVEEKPSKKSQPRPLSAMEDSDSDSSDSLNPYD